MKRRIENYRLILGAALALLASGWARAQSDNGQDASAGATVAAATTTAQPGAATPAAATAPAAGGNGSSKVDQTKDQLTRMPSAADLRPSGPVTIGANHAELVQGNSATYSGNVTLDSDTLKMDGDRLDLKRAADGQYTAKITGSPAHMSHAGNGPDNPPVTARAKTMIYDSRAGTVDLMGDALMTKGDEKTTAETIRYHVLEQRYEASGGDGSNGGSGRVTIIIPQVPGAPPAGGTTPATAPPAGSPAPASKPQSPAPQPDAQPNTPKP